MTSSTSSQSQVRPLPLLDLHKARGAKLAEFAGWQVPIYFSSILDEHSCVRDRAGVFDISHMGYFTLSGEGVKSFLDHLLAGPVSTLEPGKALYTVMTNEEGGILDDVILYCQSATDYFLIVNAGTCEKDWNWIQHHKPKSGVILEDLSLKKVLFAVQGPASEFIVSSLFKTDLSSIKRFEFVKVSYKNQAVYLCRTGYTGEDGFEILAPLSIGKEIWEGLLKEGESHGLEPVGFGARDTLRLEARYSLYSHDMDESTTPLEAGLSWVIDWNKDFIGSKKIKSLKEKGIEKRLVGFEVMGRTIPREGYELFCHGKPVGKVTSGCLSPTLKRSIGLGYVRSPKPISEGLEIKIRGELYVCRIIKGPFYVGESLKKFSK